jgi:hypothetical protein
MAWFRKSYACPCGEEWTDEWSCLCNDKCPSCNKEIEPDDDSEDLTVIVDGQDGAWQVLQSPETAEDSPDYRVVETYADKSQAEAHAKQLADA